MTNFMTCRLLIVDDEMPIVKFLLRSLEKDGHTCQTALSANEAKSLMKSNSFDLIITDLKMPGESGLDLLKFAAEFYPETGRIMMTGYHNRDAEQKALQIGVYGYLIKPLNSQMINVTIQNSLRRVLLENQMHACLNEAQKEVVDKNRTLEAVLNNIDIGVALIDREMKVLSLNKTMELMCPEINYQKQKHCYDNITEYSTKGLCDDCPLVHAFETKMPFHTERVVRTDDVYKEYKISAIPILENDKSVNKGMILYHDLTDLMETQRSMSESSKLAAVGQLAAGITHEINTPSQFLGDNIRFLEESFKELEPLFPIIQEIQGADISDQPALYEKCRRLKEEVAKVDLDFLQSDIPEAIEQSLEGVRRVREIVMAMKDFSHPGEQDKAPSNINEQVRNTLTVCRNEWKYVAEITLDLDDNLPLVECLQNEINQVILILIVNGAHSIEEKISDGNSKMGQIHITTKNLDQKYVQLTVRDTGNGIPYPIQDKIFEAFFTTKKQGKGTGQGLSMAQHIVMEKHCGKLGFSSEPGVGTEFSITLPVSSAD